MEGYTRHSRSHSRAPPHPSTAGNGARKVYSNGGAGNGFTAYDDVFGGPPKFGVTPFTPRAEDYSEIFGTFPSSRSSSIPVLDLPPVDDAVVAFDAARCSGFEYSDVFGGFDFADFAVPYDELFGRSHEGGGDESSDDAWTQAETESLTGESDPSACSERNPYFLNGDFHQSLDCNQLSVSYHKVNLGATEDSNMTHIARLSAVSGYTYVIDGSASLQKEDDQRYSSGVADDIILCEDSSGNISLETLQKSSPVPSCTNIYEQLHDYDGKTGMPHEIVDHSMKPTIAFMPGNSLRKESPDLQPPSTPPTSVERTEDSISSNTDHKHSKCHASETKVDRGSLHFLDFDLHAGSSAVASAAAIKEAMDRAKVKLKSAKESMERKKDGLKGTKAQGNSDMKGEGVTTVIFKESVLSNPEQRKECQKHDRFMDSVEELPDSSRAPQVSPDFKHAEDIVNRTTKNVCGSITEDYGTFLDPYSTIGVGQRKEATQYSDLINGHSSNAEPSLPDVATKLVHSFSASDAGDANQKNGHFEPKMEGVGLSTQENGDSKSDEEQYDPRVNRRKLRTVKAGSRKDFHEKMVKVAEEVHEKLIGHHVETEKILIGVDRGHGIKRNLEIWPEGKTDERRFNQAAHHADPKGRHKRGLDKDGSELRSSEHRMQTDNWMKETDREGSKMYEYHAKEETQKSSKEVEDMSENGNGLREAAFQVEEMVGAGAWKEQEAATAAACRSNGNLNVVNDVHEEEGDIGRSGWTTRQYSDMGLNHDYDTLEGLGELWGRVGNVMKLEETNTTEKCQEHNDDSVTLDSHKKILKDSVEWQELENCKVAQEDGVKNDKSEEEVDNVVQECEVKESLKVYEASKKDKEKKKLNDDVPTESNSYEQDSHPGSCQKMESGYLQCPNSPSMLDERNFAVPDAASNLEEKDIEPNAAACEHTDMSKANASQGLVVDEERGDCEAFSVESESKATETADVCYSTEHLQKTGDAIDAFCDVDNASKAEKVRKVDGLEKERLRKLKKERGMEIDKKKEAACLRKLEELRKKEWERESEECLRKLNEERERDKQTEQEKEHLRKLEEEREREREREKDRMGVEKITLEASERAERAAVERATAEARQRAMTEARERLEKACAEARDKSSSEKSSVEARLRAERAAVERATSEARERAIEKAISERAVFGARVERSASEKVFPSVKDMGLRHCLSSSDLWDEGNSDGIEGESAQRCKARLERHRRTVERVAKALAEKNMRDLIAQREQAERNRFAETLDAEVKRWSNGKEGNLRALLSTLHYILRPDSGWQPIPLTEVITSAGVKKAYRKATLWVHPDKLQQRGASIQQKYVCEKVFDLLKDAWSKFNSEER